MTFPAVFAKVLWNFEVLVHVLFKQSLVGVRIVASRTVVLFTIVSLKVLFKVMFMSEPPLAVLFGAFVWLVNFMTQFMLLELALEWENLLTSFTFELTIHMFVSV